MKISVAMAAYNGEAYIVEQLQSIMAQSRMVDEVRICDDCSSDQTVKVVQSFLMENGLEKDWSICVNARNLGYASNFIEAANQTTGDFIFFCDQDDIWPENRIAEMVQIMEENPQIMVLGSEFESFVSSPDACSVPKWELAQFKGDGSISHLPFNASNFFIGYQGCTMCVRREFYEEAMPYWYQGWAHDEFVWKLALCRDGLYIYHAPTLLRRLHSDNVSLHKKRDLQKRIVFLEDLLKSHEATLQFAKDIGLSEKRIHLIKRNITATKLRIELLKNRKYLNTISLFVNYRDCYHKRRAILVELYMAIKA